MFPGSNGGPSLLSSIPQPCVEAIKSSVRTAMAARDPNRTTLVVLGDAGWAVGLLEGNLSGATGPSGSPHQIARQREE
jgi:putative AlgH/UPF0301 family transcriptional regulator